MSRLRALCTRSSAGPGLRPECSRPRSAIWRQSALGSRTSSGRRRPVLLRSVFRTMPRNRGSSRLSLRIPPPHPLPPAPPIPPHKLRPRTLRRFALATPYSFQIWTWRLAQKRLSASAPKMSPPSLPFRPSRRPSVAPEGLSWPASFSHQSLCKIGRIPIAPGRSLLAFLQEKSVGASARSVKPSNGASGSARFLRHRRRAAALG